MLVLLVWEETHSRFPPEVVLSPNHGRKIWFPGVACTKYKQKEGDAQRSESLTTTGFSGIE